MPTARAPHFELGDGRRLESFDQREVAGREPRERVVQRQFAAPRNSCISAQRVADDTSTSRHPASDDGTNPCRAGRRQSRDARASPAKPRGPARKDAVSGARSAWSCRFPTSPQIRTRASSLFSTRPFYWRAERRRGFRYHRHRRRATLSFATESKAFDRSRRNRLELLIPTRHSMMRQPHGQFPSGALECGARCATSKASSSASSPMCRRREPHRVSDAARAAEKIVREAAQKAAFLSGSLALPPGPIGMLTVLPDLYLIWKVQRQMVADIFALHGREPSSRGRTCSTACSGTWRARSPATSSCAPGNA